MVAAGSPTQLLEFLKLFPTLRHETRMTSVRAAATSFGQPNWMRCWPIPHTSIGSMSCSENSMSCLEIKLLRSKSLDLGNALGRSVA